MNFYFCEKCGKRITEIDIQAGQGRDKKLKGVYCEECSVGVTTMASLPVVGDDVPEAFATAIAENRPIAPPRKAPPIRSSSAQPGTQTERTYIAIALIALVSIAMLRRNGRSELPTPPPAAHVSPSPPVAPVAADPVQSQTIPLVEPVKTAPVVVNPPVIENTLAESAKTETPVAAMEPPAPAKEPVKPDRVEEPAQKVDVKAAPPEPEKPDPAAAAAQAAKEEAAKKAWTELAAHISKASLLSQVKTCKKEIDDFSAGYADTAYIKLPDVIAAKGKAQQNLHRLELGLDPRLPQLFAGRVSNFNPRSLELTVDYDFSVKDQQQDFKGRDWNSPTLRFQKGGLLALNDHNLNLGLKVPYISNDDVTISMAYKDLDRDLIIFGFFLQESLEAKPAAKDTVGVAFQHGTVGLYKIGNINGALVHTYASKPLAAGKLAKTGVIEIKLKNNTVTARLNGELIFEQPCDQVSHQSGICIGGGNSTRYLITSLRIAGQLSTEWLEGMLEKK